MKGMSMPLPKMWFAMLYATALIATTQHSRGEDRETRIAVALTAPEKAYVLGQMRLFVTSVQEIVAALAVGDRRGAEEAAAARGAKGHETDGDAPATLRAKLPENWKLFGRTMRLEFDALSQGLGEGEATNPSLARLGGVMRYCVACHESYRIVDAER